MGLFVVGGADNIIRPYFISRGSDLPLFWSSSESSVELLPLAFSVYSWGTLLATGYEIVRDWLQIDPPAEPLADES